MPHGGTANVGKDLKRIKALFKKNRLRDAKPLCDRVFAHKERSANFLHLYGLTLRACEDLTGALEKIYAAHEQKPDDANILNSLGMVFSDMNDTETAITLFKRATSADQKCYQAWINLGNALLKVDRFEASAVALVCAHHLDRSNLEPLFCLAVLEFERRDYERSAEILDELLEHHKDVTPLVKLRRLQVAKVLEDLDYVEQNMNLIDPKTLNNSELADLDRVKAEYYAVYDRFDEAIAILEKAIERDGERRHDLIAHLGYCYGEAGRVSEGLAMLKGLLKQHPDHEAARYNLSFLQFKAGEVADGFKNYESRWQFRGFPSNRRKFDAPVWRGEPVEGKSILVWREQGIGDEVRFASLLPELHERGCSITFECKKKLVPLWEACFPWATIRPEGDIVCINDPEYIEFDYQIPIGNLGGVFRSSVEDFEKKKQPWIVRNHDTEAQIRDQLAVQHDDLLIGVCWRSINQITSRSKVFLNSEQLAAFEPLTNASWLNLQYGSTPDEVHSIRQGGLDLHNYIDVDQKDDLVSACNLIGACDLVISVGGSVGDLAGGLGVPMVYMTRELSEVFLGTDEVPWFVNCKSYPIAAYQSDATIARIVKDWSIISKWAEDLKPEDRKSHRVSSQSRSALDLEYPVSRGAQS